ncbi:MAG TPA: hypothetical protein VI197_17750 [Polyangiaceae bacterium]
MLLVAAGSLGGCHKIFGEYEVIEEPPPPPPPTTLCVAGDLRCVGPLLYTCGADLQSWTYLETCSSDARCLSREGGCKPCVSGEHRCEGATLEVCDEDFGWTTAGDCGHTDACNLNSESCRPCTENEHVCNQGALMRCSSERAWVLVEQCANQAACSVAPDKTSGSCAPVDPRCTASLMHVCDGATLLRCSESRDRLIPIESCISAAHCSAAAADQQAEAQLLGTCLQDCEPDTLRCVEAELQRCSTDRIWMPMMACASPGACSATSGCEPCTAGALECNDAELRRCAPERASGWEVVADCGVARLCNAAEGRCEAGGCPRAGQTRCDIGPERCKPDQSEWDTIDICDEDLCVAHDAKCEIPACAKGARRCWQGNLEQCDDSLRGWETLKKCDEDETCSLDGCSRSGCMDGEYRCNDVYRETCNGGKWERVERCATAALCTAADQPCAAPACEAKAYTCTDGTLRRCEADRAGYESSRDCEDAGLTCDAYAGACR